MGISSFQTRDNDTIDDTSSPFSDSECYGETRSSCFDKHLTKHLLTDKQTPFSSGLVTETQSVRTKWIDLPSGRYLVFEYYAHSTMGWFGRLFHGNHAQRTCQHIQNLQRCEIPTLKAIAWVARAKPEPHSIHSLLITEFQPSGTDLMELLSRQSLIELRTLKDITNQTARLIARCHNHGYIFKADSSGNNAWFWYKQNEHPCSIGIAAPDLLKKKPWMNWHDRIKNIALLGQGCLDTLPAKLVVLFWQTYLSNSDGWSPPFDNAHQAIPALAHAVQHYATKYHKKTWQRLTRFCLQDPQQFHHFGCGKTNAFIRSEWDCPKMRDLLCELNKWIDQKDTQILKDETVTTVAKISIPISGDLSKSFIIKRYNNRKITKQTKNLFRPPRAVSVLKKSQALALLSIATPRAVAAVVQKSGILNYESSLVTEPVAPLTGPYSELCGDSEQQSGNLPIPIFRTHLADLVGRLHSHGISHGDLQISNLAFMGDPEGGMQPSLLDLDALRLKPLFFEYQRVRDLAVLLKSFDKPVSLNNKVRFFRTYCRGNQALWERRRRIGKSVHRRLKRLEHRTGI